MLICDACTCQLCDELLLDRPYLVTQYASYMSNPRFSRYYAATIHWDCVPGWDEREAFSRDAFVSNVAGSWMTGATFLHATPDWVLMDDRRTSHYQAEPVRVELARWPFSLSSSWSAWDEFIGGEYRRELGDCVLEAVAAIVTEIRSIVPTLAALEDLRAERAQAAFEDRSHVGFDRFLERLWGDAAPRVDWQFIQWRIQADRDEFERGQREHDAALLRSNRIAHGLALELSNGGSLSCPHCRCRNRDMRFINKHPHERSYFICQRCGCSFSGAQARV